MSIICPRRRCVDVLLVAQRCVSRILLEVKMSQHASLGYDIVDTHAGRMTTFDKKVVGDQVPREGRCLLLRDQGIPMRDHIPADEDPQSIPGN